MSTSKTPEELSAHMNDAISAIQNFIQNYIDSEDPDMRSKGDKFCYWMENYIKYLKYETTFDPTSLKRYKRGEIVKVTLGYNIGSEEGGLHYAVVIDKGQEIIQTPKTPRGVRRISIPKFLYDELKDYISKLYGIKKGDRIFYCTKAAFEADIVRGAEKVGLPLIRVHDLRHSNASLLINMGVDIMEISRRLGHESVKTTWDIYGHLYPNKDKELADMLHKLKENKFEDKKTEFPK